jgi:hypothetical protein
MRATRQRRHRHVRVFAIASTACRQMAGMTPARNALLASTLATRAAHENATSRTGDALRIPT